MSMTDSDQPSAARPQRVQPRPRTWPAKNLDLIGSVLAFLDCVNLTAVNKIAGVDESQARRPPLASSPVMNPFGG
ncbi:MAG: hypothetical protein ACRCYU_22350 [Nocardioides sp.]